MTKEDVNDVYELIMEQRARIEALEAALWQIEGGCRDHSDPWKHMREIARAALAQSVR